MVRLLQHKDDSIHGDLVIERHTADNIVEVHYIPPPSRLAEYGVDPDDAEKHKTKLLEFDTKSGRFTIFPTNTIGPGEDFLKPKYRKVRKITLTDAEPVLSVTGAVSEFDRGYTRSVTFGPTQPLDNHVDDSDIASAPEAEEQIIAILEDLPAAFTKDYDYGLGLAKPYRFIVEAVEELSDCTEIEISREGRTRVDETASIFHIKTSDFDAIRKMLNSTTRMGQIAGRSVKKDGIIQLLCRAPRAPAGGLEDWASSVAKAAHEGGAERRYEPVGAGGRRGNWYCHAEHEIDFGESSGKTGTAKE